MTYFIVFRYIVVDVVALILNTLITRLSSTIVIIMNALFLKRVLPTCFNLIKRSVDHKPMDTVRFRSCINKYLFCEASTTDRLKLTPHKEKPTFSGNTMTLRS